MKVFNIICNFIPITNMFVCGPLGLNLFLGVPVCSQMLQTLMFLTKQNCKLLAIASKSQMLCLRDMGGDDENMRHARPT